MVIPDSTSILLLPPVCEALPTTGMEPWKIPVSTPVSVRVTASLSAPLTSTVTPTVCADPLSVLALRSLSDTLMYSVSPGKTSEAASVYPASRNTSRTALTSVAVSSVNV